jgi:hypothetical protein
MNHRQYSVLHPYHPAAQDYWLHSQPVMISHSTSREYPPQKRPITSIRGSHSSQAASDVRSIDSCCGIVITADSIRFQVRYRMQTLTAESILGCVSLLGRLPSAVIQSLDGSTEDLEYALSCFLQDNYSPIVCWSNETLSYSTIADMKKRSLVLALIWRYTLFLLCSSWTIISCLVLLGLCIILLTK